MTLGQLNAWIVGWEVDREVLQTQGQNRKMKILLFGGDVWLAWGGGGIRGETCHIIPSTFSLKKIKNSWLGELCVGEGDFFFSSGDDFSFSFFFPRTRVRKNPPQG